MFQSLTKNLVKIFERIQNKGLLTESQILESLRDIRIALLEADVSLSVVKQFIEIVKSRALGQEIIKSISPGQMMVKIIHEELTNILSSREESQLRLNTAPPVNILLVGLQGSGKTTASAKIGLKLKNLNKKVLLVSLDTYRPAAQKQLALLGQSADIDTLEILQEQSPLEIVNRALGESKLGGYDVVIYDTAGRLHIDDTMISELLEIKQKINPSEILLVVDAMTGQDAVKIADEFNKKIDITGLILSKVDGDARGGAALSIKYITDKSIKFLSVGEKLKDLEEFDPKRIASRILDMGDILSLVEHAANTFSQEESDKALKKAQKGKFDLEDYMSQIRNIKNMGGMGKLLNMIPGMTKIRESLNNANVNEKMIVHQEAIILSMTQKERINPSLLNASRKRRIANGSGTSVQQVNILLKQFMQINSLMKQTTKLDPKTLQNKLKTLL